MVRLRHVAVALAAWVAASLAAPADEQKPPPDQQKQPQQQSYTPRLNSLMILTQLGHFKLWYAGAVQNWPLANYELTQIRANIVDAKRLYPNNSKSDMSAMNPAADDLGKAIEAKDTAKFVYSFNKLTNACNACHEASGVGFIRIRVPRLSPIETSPFSDESFSGK
jgi:cytochrome c553